MPESSAIRPVGQSQRRVIILLDTASAGGSDILRGVARYMRLYRPWQSFHDDHVRAADQPDWLYGDRWDGILVRSHDEALLAGLRQRGLPVVQLDESDTNSAFPRVRSDNRAIGRLAAQHLSGLGLRHFAFCGFDNAQWSIHREEGFITQLEGSARKAHRFRSKWPSLQAPKWRRDEERDITTWLAGLPRPVGVFAANDLRGQHVVQAAFAAGFAVPDEVAVLSVNNDPVWTELTSVPLSSVCPNFHRVGYTAAETLDRLMGGHEDVPFEQLIPPLHVEVRQSTDTLAIDDDVTAKALSYIRANATSGINVQDVLAVVPASRSVLERRFRRFLGHSPQVEIRQCQVRHAKLLLTETDYPLKQIAPLAGFAHEQYLCAVFRRLTGLTPGQYRDKSERTSA